MSTFSLTVCFEEIYAQQYPCLLRWVQTHTHSYEQAEEIVQETFLRAWKAWPTFTCREHSVKWLYVVVRNIVCDAARHQRVLDCCSLDSLLDEPVDPQDDYQEQEALLQLWQAARCLSPEALSLLLLRAQGGTFAELATHLGITPSAAKARYARVRTIVKRAYHGEVSP